MEKMHFYRSCKRKERRKDERACGECPQGPEGVGKVPEHGVDVPAPQHEGARDREERAPDRHEKEVGPLYAAEKEPGKRAEVNDRPPGKAFKEQHRDRYPRNRRDPDQGGENRAEDPGCGRDAGEEEEWTEETRILAARAVKISLC